MTLPTGVQNTLTINSNGLGSFNDPFTFDNTNNGYNTYTGNGSDALVFNGFNPTTTTISSSEFSAMVNGVTYFFIGFVNPNPPTPTPPTPLLPMVVAQSQQLQAAVLAPS